MADESGGRVKPIEWKGKEGTVRDRARMQGNPFRSKLLWVALALMVVGGGVWAYAESTREERARAVSGGGVGDGSGAAGFAPGATGGGAPGSGGAAEPTTEQRLIDEGGPATFRLGLSFAAGYFLAWGLRVVAKVTLLVFGAAAVVLILLTHFNVMGLNWAMLQDKLESSFAMVQGKAGQFKEFILGYLPSAGAAVAGTVVGFRRRG